MAPPLHTLGDWRSSLLVCDECDKVMDVEGQTTSKSHRVSSPDDLAPHYMAQSDATVTARTAGWNEDETGRWSCPPCSSRRNPPTTG